MRISDWSSDVCSSDLLDERLPTVVEGAERSPGSLVTADGIVEMKAVDRQALRDRCGRGSLLGGLTQCDQLVRGIGPGPRRHRGARGGRKLEVVAPPVGQIGRASGRERVCQYV